jgi:cell fate regulator YaaT (PSP1 superfamily)
MANNLENKPKQVKNKKYMLVRYGRMNLLGFFEHNEGKISKVNTDVVVKTDKGLELGRLVGPLDSYRSGQFKLSENAVKKYFGEPQIDLPRSRGGKFVRYATRADISEQEHLQKIAGDEVAVCRRVVEELNLPMKIIDAEHIFGGERVIFYFMSESRIDFRDLVKRLANDYQTRIEMRQIGARDEAKLLGDVESCGQECCCKRFLRLLKPVNMRMAKMQKATLDPTKISGYCGRLKCCLRYEDKNYTELKKKLPRRDAWVSTKNGEGRVVDTQIITQLVVVEYDGGTRAAVPVDEIEVIAQTRPSTPQKEDDPGREKNADESKKEASEEKGARAGRGKRGGRNRKPERNKGRRDGQDESSDDKNEQESDAAELPENEQKSDAAEPPKQNDTQEQKHNNTENPKQDAAEGQNQ